MEKIKRVGAILLVISLIIITGSVREKMTAKDEPIKKVLVVQKDTIKDVSGSVAMFIGDSHTANSYWGWQTLLCDKTGMKIKNLSVGGKTTTWMLGVAKKSINKDIDYCFIYGGANDMYNSQQPNIALNNIQSIVNICKLNNVEAIVITGFNPITCTNVTNVPNYSKNYYKFQQMMIDSIKDARVIDTRPVVVKSDCGDRFCHMNYSGHKKISDTLISALMFKRIK